jgi:hypothetical protein
VKPLLVKARGVPASLVDSVWERPKLHYRGSQYPLNLKAYIEGVVHALGLPKGGGALQDESGDGYVTVRWAAEELRRDKTTIYRWIEDRMLKRTREIIVHRHGGNTGDVLFGVLVMEPDFSVAEAVTGHHLGTSKARLA